MQRIASLLVAVLTIVSCTSIERSFLPEAALVDPYWRSVPAAPQATVDHAAWSDFLARYLATDAEGVSRLDYRAVTPDDRSRLEAYLARLETTAVTSLPRDEQFAFWVNLYNAKTVGLVLEHYPVASLRDIADGWFDIGPWNDKRLEVEGRRLSLDDIEHGILRPVFVEPRIHYVLNCAAAGCPNLGHTAYGGDDLEARLEAAARAYVNDPRGVHIDARGRLVVSKIYAWFREDFGGSEAAAIEHLRRYAEPELRARLAGRERVDGYRYDWSLNDRRPAGAAASRHDAGGP